MGTQPYSPTNPRARYVRAAIATVILIVALCVFVSAGIWQLGRAEQKNELQAEFSRGSMVEAIPEPVSEQDRNDYRFRRFELSGRYLPDQQILLDNIVADGRNGYQVVTPFVTNGQTVLVNRGWVPADVDRRILPVVAISAAERTILARLNYLPVPGLRLEAPPEKGWPRRMLYPTRAEIVAALGIDVPDYQFLLAPEQPDGYKRNWQASKFGPTKHYGYAFQWFAFAALTLLFYVLLIFRWKETPTTDSDTNPKD
jgi:surfeit locus 1 family protein